MSGPVERSNLGLEKVCLDFFGDFRAGQFFDRNIAPGAAVTGTIEVVPDGRADYAGDGVGGV